MESNKSHQLITEPYAQTKQLHGLAEMLDNLTAVSNYQSEMNIKQLKSQLKESVKNHKYVDQITNFSYSKNKTSINTNNNF